MDLVNKYLGFLKPVTNTLSGLQKTAIKDVGDPIRQGIQNAASFVAKQPLTTMSPGFGINIPKPSNLSPTFGQYTQGQIQQPLLNAQRSLNQPGLVNKAAGLLSIGQAGYNATPMGLLQNILVGTGGGAVQAFRTGKPLDTSINQAIANPTSITNSVTGNTNPYLAMLGDTLLTRNPQKILEDPLLFKDLKNIVSNAGKMSALDNPAINVLQKDAHAQVAQNQPFFQDLLKRYDLQLGSEAPKTGVNKIDLNLAPDMVKAYQLLFGAKSKPPRDMGEMAQDIRTVFRETLADKRAGNVPQAFASNLVGNQEPLPWENGAASDVSGAIKPPIEIPTDAASQMRAEAQTLAQNGGKGGLAGINPDIRNAFADWVNARKASQVEGFIKKQDFQDLNEKGIQGIFEFQSGDKSGRFQDVKNFFDQKYADLKDAGVKLNYLQDYLPQLWNNGDEEVKQVFGNTLSKSAPFTMERMIKDYQTGIQAGLTPKFQNISDLVGWYEGRANKLLADKGFFDHLGKDGFIQPSSKAPQDWVTLNPDRFPKIKSSFDGKVTTGSYKAPPELANKINNYLYNPQDGSDFSRGLASIAGWTSAAKNRLLSFGVPGTGINAHGFNILARNTLASKNPISGFLKAGYFMVNPKAAEETLFKDLGTAPFAVRHGLTFNVEDHNVLTTDPGIKGKFGSKWNDLFEKPLFDKMLPALKLQYFNELYNTYKGSMEDTAAAKEAAKTANTMFGGYNWEQLGKSRDMQNLKKTLLLAPDWATSNLQLGKGVIKGVLNPTDPAFKAYRRFATNFLGSYVLANAVNKVSSGHFMYQNDPGHTFEIESGYTNDGQKRYVRPYGTAVDALRLPFDAAAGLAQGDPTAVFRSVSNRLSAPVGAGVGLLTNTDYQGHSIYGKDKYGNDMTPLQSAGGIGGQLSQGIGVPSFSKNALDVATGRQGMEQGVLQGLELPVRYTGGATSAIAKQIQPVAQGEGQSGKQLFDTYQSLKGQSKFSPNQMQYVSGEGTKGVQQLLQERQLNQQVNAAKKQALQGDAVSSSVTQVSAAGPTTNPAQLKVQESIAREKVKLNGGTQNANGKLIYQDKNGSVASLDLGKFDKPVAGIDALVLDKEKPTAARTVYGISSLNAQQKQQIYDKLGVTAQQVQYDYVAHQASDIKAKLLQQSFASQSHDQVVADLTRYRTQSVSGSRIADDSTLTYLNDVGVISDAEAKALKKITPEKAGSTSGGSAKVKSISIPKAPAITVAKAPRVKEYKLSLPQIKAVNLNPKAGKLPARIARTPRKIKTLT